jgi:2-polyprenyl-3-methyl-5-hydroxy-6-metoxy-1,4-benzoquinol methylase
MESLNSCPVCESKRFEPFQKIRDHFLTKESFQIIRCVNCGFLFTNPRPGPAEIIRYYQSDAYISHAKNSKGWLSVVYEAVRKVSLRRKYNLIRQHKSGSTILDIGCGTGEFLNFMKGKGWETTGIEPAREPRTYAKETYDLAVFGEEKLEKLSVNSFDVITMWHVLEHVHDLNGRIEQIKKILSPDGLLVIAIPNCKSRDAEFYQEYWAAWDVPRHLYHFSQQTFSLLMMNHGFEIISTHPMKFDAYYVSLLSEKYKRGKSRLPAALFNGFRSNKTAKKNQNNYSSLIFLLKLQNR